MNKPEDKALPRRRWISLAVLLIVIPLLLYFCRKLGNRYYYIASLLIILCTTLPFLMVFERRRPQARELVLLAVLSALAVASRAAFIWLPHFKPTCAIIMIAGMAFGAESGFMVGAVTAFASNFIFGQGPWTPWQMFAFGMAGFLAGLFCKRGLLKENRFALAGFGFIMVFLLIGPLLDTCALFTMASTINISTASAVYLSGIPVNLVHATAVGLTLLLFSRAMLEKLDRVRMKYGMLEG